MDFNQKKFYLPTKLLKRSYFERNGFRYSKVHSDDDSTIYTYRFIVWRFGSAGVLEAEIRICEQTGEVAVGCYDYGTRSPYASWYCRKYGKNDVVDIIDQKIMDELTRLGIKEKHDNSW